MKRDLKRLQKIATSASAAALNSGGLAAAAGSVIAHRLHPATASHAEFARMVPEKTQAMAEMSTALMSQSLEAVGKNVRSAMIEGAIASKAALALALTRSPQAAAAVQQDYLTGWFTRSISNSLALGLSAFTLQAALMLPLHRAATGNARRLGL
jgi:hypothetical protein